MTQQENKNSQKRPLPSTISRRELVTGLLGMAGAGTILNGRELVANSRQVPNEHMLQSINTESASSSGIQLKISDFIENDDPWIDNRAGVQAAVDELIQKAKYVSLDFEGRFLTVGGPIILDRTSGVSGYTRPTTLMNGTLRAKEFTPETPFWASDGSTPILQLVQSGGGRIEEFNINDMSFQCDNVASGIELTGSYIFIRISRVRIKQPRVFGVRDDVNGAGGGLYIDSTAVTRFESFTPFQDRETIGFDIYANDAKILQCTTTYCKTGLHVHKGNLLLANSHFYQGHIDPDSGAKDWADYNPCLILTSGYSSKIVNCYFDNSPVRLDFCGKQFISGVDFDSCVFFVNGGKSDYRFIESFNSASDAYFNGFSIRGCSFKSYNNSGHPSLLFGHKGAGRISPNNSTDFSMENTNKFTNVPKQLSRTPLTVALTGAGDYSFDLTGQTPFGLNINSYEGLTMWFWQLTNVSSEPKAYIHRTSGKTFTLRVKDDPGKGKVRFYAVCAE